MSTSSKPKFLDPGAYYADLSTYLDKNRVYDTLDFMAKELLAAKPEKPIDFLLNLLRNSKKGGTAIQRVLILGANPKDCEIYGRKIADQLGIHRLRGDRLGNEDEIYSKIDECNDKGWTLSGYPTCPEEAFKIIEKNIIISRIVVVQPRGGWEDTGYHLFLSTLCDPFPRKLISTITVGSGTEDDDLETVISLCTSKARLLDNVKPRPPPKVILYSARGAGHGTQGHDLALKLGVPHIDLISLAKDAGNNIRKGVNLIKSRISQVDCRQLGFVISIMTDMDIDIPTLQIMLNTNMPGSVQLLEIKSDHDKPHLQRMRNAFPLWKEVDPKNTTRVQLSQSLMLALEEIL